MHRSGGPPVSRARPWIIALGAALAGLLALWSASQSEGAGGKDDRALQPVLISTAPIGARELLDAKSAAAKLTTRKVPTDFIPSGALQSPAQVIGRALAVDLPAGSYLTGSALRQRKRNDGTHDRLAPGLHVVEIAIDSYGAVNMPGASSPGSHPEVDVVITSMPRDGRDGRTYVAASNVPLIGFGSPEGPGAKRSAILGLERPDALELIHAESYARSIRLLASGADANTLR